MYNVVKLLLSQHITNYEPKFHVLDSNRSDESTDFTILTCVFIYFIVFFFINCVCVHDN